MFEFDRPSAIRSIRKVGIIKLELNDKVAHRKKQGAHRHVRLTVEMSVIRANRLESEIGGGFGTDPGILCFLGF